MAGFLVFGFRYGCIRSGDGRALEYRLSPEMSRQEVEVVFEGCPVSIERTYPAGREVSNCDIVYQKGVQAFSCVVFDCGLVDSTTVYFSKEGTVVAAYHMKIS